MKVLTVCNHGNVRSVSLAWAIKHRSTPNVYQHEAIAIGAEYTSRPTLDLLINWADVVVWLSENVSAPESDKVANYVKKVGADRWFNPFHPELVQLMNELANEVLLK